MNKIANIFRIMLLMLFICAMASGCSVVQDQIKENSSDKEQCILDEENVTKFTYRNKCYIILDDTVANENLGEWVGYIRKLAVVDENGKILMQEYIEDATFHTLADISDNAPNAKYIIPFLNVYAVPNDASYLIVDVNGGYHKAIPSKQLTDTDSVFDYKSAAEKSTGDYNINPQNATQVISGDRIYQVTSEIVEKDQLGSYLDVMAKKVTFNADTKIPLTKEELNKIDWAGNSTGQKRESWFYVDVCVISGTDTQEAIAVKVNNQYYIAKVQ